MCVASAQGQAVLDEGFPTKPVSSEAFPDASGDACVSVLFPGEFEERCIEDNGAKGPDAFGERGNSSPFEASDPLWSAPPRLECPSAVFLEEMETASIDCRAWDASGQEAREDAIDYAWESVGGAARDYMEHPRLTPQDVPNPLLVAPSSPFYDTLQSFLAEETTKKYRYRLRATSRVTGLSSFAEVDVFVLLNRPSVHCPLEVEVEEGSTVALSCEGADPLSFRMDEGAGSSAAWEWEGLWGASTSALSATDLPAPFFRAPFGAVGETYHYVASMTTTSSGVPRTARRKVSVTVVASEDAALETAHTPPPTISCVEFNVYPTAPNFQMDCEVTNEPPGAAYSWTARGSGQNTDPLSDTSALEPEFSMAAYEFESTVDGDILHEYTLTLSAPGIADVTEDVTVTILQMPDLMDCVSDYEVQAGAPDFRLDCKIKAPYDPVRGGIWAWSVGPLSGGKREWDMRLRLPPWDASQFDPVFDVPESLPAGVSIDYYQFYLCVWHYGHPSGYPCIKSYRLVESEYITVKVVKKSPVIAVECADPEPVYEGAGNITLECSAPEAPLDATYAWEAVDSAENMDLLVADADGPTPTFAVPDEVEADETYEYRLTVSAEDMEDGAADIAVTVLNMDDIAVACTDPEPVYEGSPDVTLACSAADAPADASYVWEARGAPADLEMLIAGADGPTPTFRVPDEVEADETYEYRLTVSAENMQDGVAKVTVTVLQKPAIAVECTDPEPVYEGSGNITLDCRDPEASSDASYVWEAVDSAENMALLVAGADGPTPTFAVPDEVERDKTYEYRLTVSAENMRDGAAKVTVTVLQKPAVAVECTDPESVYEGSEPITLDCSAPGAPADASYVWEALGAPSDLGLLVAGTDGPTPTFAVPDEVERDKTYEYRLTVSAENMRDGAADVGVTVLKKKPLAVSCPGSPYSAYEGEAAIAIECSAEGGPSGSEYAYAWEARDATADTDLLSAADISSPSFMVPAEVDQDETYEYSLTVSAESAEPATVDITVTVLPKELLVVSCFGNPYSAYEGSESIALDCSATGAPEGSSYGYVWEARGATADTDLLSATDISSPTFAVPAEVDADETYEYRLTVSAENAETSAVDVIVTVLQKESLAISCPGNPYSAYEGAEDITLDCTATGAPEGSSYDYAWEARGVTADTDRLVAGADGPTPTFAVPDAVDSDETYEYRLTVSAENAEQASANITVTVLQKPAIVVSCPGNPYSAYEASPDVTLDCSATGAPEGSEYAYAWEARGATADIDLLVTGADGPTPTFAVPDAVDEDEAYEYRLTVSAENAETSAIDITVTVLDRPVSDLAALGLSVEASLLRFGTQAANTQVALDPLTDRITNSLSGAYHAGRMTLALSDAEAEAAFSIELLSPATLRLVGDADASPLALAPTWSYVASCEERASTAIRGLSMETTLSEADDCRLLLFGGSLDLAGARPGRYEGAINVVLRSGAAEETHSVPVEARVAPLSRMITIGPGGARIDAATGMPSGLTQEQNLSVYPDLAFLTDEVSSGAFALANPSLVPLEISVTARFGYAEATEDGREVVVEDQAASRLGDLSEWVEIYPRTLVLEPGEEGVVRYAMKASARSNLTEAGYAAFFELTSSPRQYVRADHMPEDVSNTARVTLRVPGAYAPGENPARLTAELLSLSQGASPSATFLVETEGRPFAGEVVAYDAGGKEFGRGRALIYTRSRVRMPLARTPEQGEAALLRFVPLHSDRAPEPVAIRWDTPGSDLREIGAAMDAKPPSPDVAPALAGKR